MTLQVEKASATSNSKVIDDYITFLSVTKGTDNVIKIKYKVKKVLPSTFDIRAYWHVYSSPKTSNIKQLKHKKGTYTLKFKSKSELIGPQYIEVSTTMGGGYFFTKKLQTFYKFPPTKTSTHTLSKKEAIADHITIAVGIASFKMAGKALKRNPYGLVLNLLSYGAGANYTLKGLGVAKGYPTPVAGQYIRSTTKYNKKGVNITVKMWSSKESYKKKVKPIYSYSKTAAWSSH